LGKEPLSFQVSAKSRIENAAVEAAQTGRTPAVFTPISKNRLRLPVAQKGIAMRKLALLILLLTAALHALPASEVVAQVSVDELEKTVARNQGKPDEHVARQLSELVLTERLSTARFSRLNAALPGEESRLALAALADTAAFLDLPASEIPATPAPDPAAQQALLDMAAGYVKKAIPQLPDFFATQETTRFIGGPYKTPVITSPGSNGNKLRVAGESSATVRVVVGKEELTDERTTGHVSPPAEKQLVVEGVFGPILKVVLKDVLGGAPEWSHWELGTTGAMAVFRFDVTQEKSHYAVGDPGIAGLPPLNAAYHGEIALDPGSGAILRLSLLAVPAKIGPVARADILVEYGPVKIGGGTYICPLRSVALSVVGNLDLLRDVYRFSQPVEPTDRSPFRLELNDVVYSQYHLFHTEMRMLPGDAPGAETNLPAMKPAPPFAAGAIPQH
jgi:hypothetical protein